jgi:lipopolysaccharide transport system ATP-binding protein
MSNIVLSVENLWKQYRLGVTGASSLREDVSRWLAKLRGKEDPTLKIGETNDRENLKGEYVWALQDISFEVKQGEVLGIIGKNGAGKSTLLKILSKVTTPTKGRVRTKGRIASILEVGTGFHPELTGRENIFLNGAILGMTKNDIRSKFDEIVEFSGVGKYIDTPVKRYSSGMYVRLAFAVAAHLEPEILIIDEVLAVGDAEFQKKCLGKMKDVSGEGRTVLFVSHNMGAVRGLCTKALLMKNGKLEQHGEVDRVISSYLTNPTGKFQIGQESKDEKIVIQEVNLLNDKGETTQNFKTGDSLTIEIKYFSKETFEKPFFWIAVESQYGSLFGANMLLDGKCPPKIAGEGVIKCTFKELPLLPQTYSIWLGARANDGRTFLTKSKEVAFFNINNKVVGTESEYADIIANDSSPIVLPYEWSY